MYDLKMYFVGQYYICRTKNVRLNKRNVGLKMHFVGLNCGALMHYACRELAGNCPSKNHPPKNHPEVRQNEITPTNCNLVRQNVNKFLALTYSKIRMF
jgi:hypothetical protein